MSETEEYAERPAVRYWITRARDLIAQGRAEFERRQAELDDRNGRRKDDAA